MRIQRPSTRSWLTALNDLRAAGDLHDGERLALRRSHRADRERNPVDLRLHHAGHRAMPLRAGPDLAFGPSRQLAQFPHLGMVAGAPSGSGRPAGSKMRGFRAEVLQEALRPQRQEAAVGAFAQAIHRAAGYVADASSGVTRSRSMDGAGRQSAATFGRSFRINGGPRQSRRPCRRARTSPSIG